MQNVFLQVTIQGNPARPISSKPACNRIVPVAKVLLPCADRSLPWLYLGKAEVLVPGDVRGRIRCLMFRLRTGSDNLSMNPMLMRPNPSHFLSRNACVYKNEGKNGSLLQQA